MKFAIVLTRDQIIDGFQQDGEGGYESVVEAPQGRILLPLIQANCYAGTHELTPWSQFRIEAGTALLIPDDGDPRPILVKIDLGTTAVDNCVIDFESVYSYTGGNRPLDIARFNWR